MLPLQTPCCTRSNLTSVDDHIVPATVLLLQEYLDREMVLSRLIYFYGPMLDMEKVDRYLPVVDELRAYERDEGKR